MKKIGICWLFLFFNVYIIQAQILAFKDDFKLEENDMDALIHHYKIDQNGNKMAIIKMVNPNKGFAFDIGSIGDALVEEKKGETWVFVPQNTKRITVNHESLGVLRNYEIPLEIEAGRVYSVTLISGTVKKEVVEAPPDFIKINSIPEGADIFINDIPLNKKTPLTNHSIAIGEYTITLSKPLYYNYKRSVTIKPNEDNKFTFTLRPNFGSLQCIADKDLQDAIIFIDEEEKGSLNKLITPIKTGTHTLLIKKELYADYTTKFTIADGEAKQLNIALTPTFGTILINANPANSSLFINKEKQPINTVIKKPAGNYFIEITNEKYYTIAKNIELTQQQQYTETITLTPKTGNIEIITTPDEAEVWLNNIKQTRTTPMIIRDVMVGDYGVEIKKNAYSTLQKNIIVKQHETAKINEILTNTKTIQIQTNPANAQIQIDGKNIGVSPIQYSVDLQKNYTLTITKNGYKSLTKQINITENAQNVLFNLEKKINLIFEDLAKTEMVFVKGGTFTMGCTNEQGKCENDEKPAHQVTLSDYYIGKYEVTQGFWKKVMGNNPSYFNNCGDDCPVEYVSWDDCQTFISKLNQLTGKRYRLPTEAEWEYAAHGGRDVAGNAQLQTKYAGSNALDEVAWCFDNSDVNYSGGYVYNGRKLGIHTVGTKKPNALGIYDMSGNVWEWCNDWYGGYSSSGVTNPKGLTTGAGRVIRGGSWNYYGYSYRVSDRSYDYSGNSGINIGLRLTFSSY